MRAFVIADAYKRKAKPIGALLWKPDPTHAQGRFVIEVASWCTPQNVPLSLSFCLNRPGRRASEVDSEEWVKSRIVPEGRHNITEVLLANGLAEYDEVELLIAANGRSSDDDFAVYEVELTGEMQRELAKAFKGSPDPQGLREPKEPFDTAADKLIAAARRQRGKDGISYAIVALPEADCSQASSSHAESMAADRERARSAAQLIGAQIKANRRNEGLTQKQLAMRAGITQTVLSRVESGTGNPTLGLLEDIAAALGTKLEVMLADR